MKLATAQEMRTFDARAVAQGMTSAVLMEHAGLRVVESIELRTPRLGTRHFVVVCGKGNNGGDGFVIARLLDNRGARVTVLLAGAQDEVRGDALVNLRLLEATDVTIVAQPRPREVAVTLAAAAVAVDALFGTGLSRPAAGLDARLIKALNSARCPVVAVDIPSGIHADTGAVLGGAVRATWTVTLALPKPGLLLHPGAEFAGELLVGDLGTPRAMLNDESMRANVATPAQIQSWLPRRRPTAHKGTFGRALLVGGSARMAGAVMLAARAALRGGAGLCAIALPQSINPAARRSLVEATTVPLPETREGTLADSGFPVATTAAMESTAIAIGPGLSRHAETLGFARRVMQAVNRPMVIDADAIVAWKSRLKALRAVAAPKILTPHPGEMAMLMGLTVAQVERDRIGIAIRCAQECNAVVLLKGARTIIAQPNGEFFVNPTGNPGMATGGAGDVLTGLIAGLIAQGMKPFPAAVAGAYIHGLAGDLVAERKGKRGLLAGDIVEALPEAFLNLPRRAAENDLTPRLYRML